MNEIIRALTEIQSELPWERLLVSLSFLVLSQAFLYGLGRIFNQVTRNYKDLRRALSLRKFFVYLYNFLVFALILKILNVDVKVILGATGLLTLAIGFAARTPISNLISGVFLLFERPFVVGNIIEVNGFRGEVVSRNLLSLTLRTLDNLMVRIPNEIVIGSSVSNMSFFPIRRLDIKFLLSSRESLTRLEEIFNEVASRNGLALDEPLPYFYVNEFKENSIEVMFRVWCSSEEFLTFQSEFPKEIHRAVKAAGMEDIRQPMDFGSPLKIEMDRSKQ
jgi:small-conductance mechanosensitive channel